MNQFVTEKELAQTFDGGYHSDSWEIVNQYRKATSYAFRKQVKSSATANALDLPRERLRVWIEGGGEPDCIRAIENARSRDWLEIGYEDTQFAALNALVANVFSGGSIAEQHYQPSFALNHLQEDLHVFDALELANLEYELHHTDERERATEVRPSTDATLLGRVLAILGAPMGPKAQQYLELPAYLEDAPEDVKRLFVVCYLENRANRYNNILRFREERNDTYLLELARLIEDVSGGPVSISGKNIILSRKATDGISAVL